MASGSDMTSDFESITSSNYAFREEGGRRYPPNKPLKDPRPEGLYLEVVRDGADAG